MQAVGCFLLEPAQSEVRPQRLIEHISASFRTSSAQHGALEAVSGNPALRLCATLILAADLGETFRFVLIGDSSLRLNGTQLFINDSGLVLVTTSLRVLAYRIVSEAGGGPDHCARVGRAATVCGAAKLQSAAAGGQRLVQECPASGKTTGLTSPRKAHTGQN